MILVKTDRTKSKKGKILKFDLVTEFEPEEIRLVDPDKIPANSLYKLSCEHIEKINKWLEKSRVIKRAIECSFNLNYKKVLEMYPDLKNGKKKGKKITFLSDKNYIFVH